MSGQFNELRLIAEIHRIILCNMISYRFIFAIETTRDKKSVYMSFCLNFERNPLLKCHVPCDDNSTYLVVKGK